MTAHGTLLVRVYTARAQIPVVDATVAISQHSDQGAETLIALELTNQSGLIPSIAIPTPALALSLHPDPALPYATCCVRVEHPGYQMLTIEAVQIFPGIETLQEVELIPLPQSPTQDDLSDTLVIPPNPL